MTTPGSHPSADVAPVAHARAAQSAASARFAVARDQAALASSCGLNLAVHGYRASPCVRGQPPQMTLYVPLYGPLRGLTLRWVSIKEAIENTTVCYRKINPSKKIGALCSAQSYAQALAHKPCAQT